MSSTRSIIAPPPFAENALTVIPPTPVAGVSYRDPVAGPASSPDGWPYAERVNSAEWNQIMYQISTLVSIIDAKGILGWSSEKDYVEPSVVFGSDGVLYKWIQPSGPSNAGAQDPISSPLYWGTLAAALNSQALPMGYFSGFTMANNSGAPNTTVDVGPGSARDTTNTSDISLTSTISGILQSSGAWAAGNGQNKLDTGARAINTWYHKFAIRKTSDGTGDILFSLSATAPTMPAGYSGFRRIGSVLTDAGGFILGFLNFGRKFYPLALVKDVSVSGMTPGSTTITLRVPTGVKVNAVFDAHVRGENNALYIRPTGTSAVTLAGPQTSAWIAGMGQDSSATTLEAMSSRSSVVTDTLAQATLQSFVGNGNVGYGVTTVYWEEF